MRKCRGLKFTANFSRANVPAMWVAVAVSLLVHVAVLWQWMPRVRHSPSETAERKDASGPLVVQLAPRPLPAPAPPHASTREARPAPAPRRPKPSAAARPRATPPVIALKKAAPGASTPPAASATAPPSARAPAEGDLAAYIEAKRRARGESAQAPAAPESVSNAPPVEDEQTRANRIAAANLGFGRKPGFGAEPKKGGIFGLQRVSYDYAEFVFYGWNKDIRRNTAQVIEVRKGNESDIRLAVVRKMISIIREHEQEDFVWESPRLGRNVTLSARPRDNAGLEDFLMREFF